MASTSVESFLKGVRSQVEISKVKEEEEEGAEKEKEGVEEDIQGVAEEANEMVVPEEDMVSGHAEEGINWRCGHCEGH